MEEADCILTEVSEFQTERLDGSHARLVDDHHNGMIGCIGIQRRRYEMEVWSGATLTLEE
jgi:hypothetical protein